MRNLFIIYGKNCDEEKTLLSHLIAEIEKVDKNKVCLLRVGDKDPQPALTQTLAKLRPFSRNPKQALILYSGENLNLFENNIPYDKINMVKLKKKIIDSVGGYVTERERQTVAIGFSNTVMALLEKE